MVDDVLRAFACQLAAEARDLASGFPDPTDGLEAVTSLLTRAASNPSAFMRAATARQPATARLPDAAAVYRERARQIGDARRSTERTT